MNSLQDQKEEDLDKPLEAPGLDITLKLKQEISDH